MQKGEVLCWYGEGCLKNSNLVPIKSKYPPRDWSVRANISARTRVECMCL